MHQILAESEKLNETIRNSEEYRRYLETKRTLYADEELFNAFREFRKKNYELQNLQGVNPYDEVHTLVREYSDLIHNSKVSDFVRAEQRICALLRKSYNKIAEGLEFDDPNE